MTLAIVNAIVGSLAVFDILFEAQPTDTEAGLKIWWQGYKRIGLVGDLVADVAIYVAGALLVRKLDLVEREW